MPPLDAHRLMVALLTLSVGLAALFTADTARSADRGESRLGAHAPGQRVQDTGRAKLIYGQPSCPASFDIHYYSSTVFACRTQATPGQEAATAYIAKSKPCEWPSYWNTGPLVTLNTAGTVYWKCEHK